MHKKFVGFGFGAIQGGLFLLEAFRSGNFKNLTVAEVLPEVVAALRASNGVYQVNVAKSDRIETETVTGVQVFNPQDEFDRAQLVKAVAEADEIATALPSVRFYDGSTAGAVINVLVEGIRLKHKRGDQRHCVIYTAENHNHAAEILREALEAKLGSISGWAAEHLQCLNTVIGKMCGIVTDTAQMREQNLQQITPKMERCFLVESFNRILVSAINFPDFQRGITVFAEKKDLLPFEEAKLYGHNAVHALLGYLARLKGLHFMADTANYPELVNFAYTAFMEESGKALCRKYAGLDPLFTNQGYKEYANDLMERILNPYLKDAVDRVTRDPERKLGWDDRLVGTMRLALSQDVLPAHYALGVAAAAKILTETQFNLLDSWQKTGASQPEVTAVWDLVENSAKKFSHLL